MDKINVYRIDRLCDLSNNKLRENIYRYRKKLERYVQRTRIIFFKRFHQFLTDLSYQWPAARKNVLGSMSELIFLFVRSQHMRRSFSVNPNHKTENISFSFSTNIFFKAKFAYLFFFNGSDFNLLFLFL